LIQFLKELSLATDPTQVMESFARHYWSLRPADYMISLSTKDLPHGLYRVTRQIDVARVMQGNGVAVAAGAEEPG
jgi:hypothetical protein